VSLQNPKVMPVPFPPHKWYYGPELKMVGTTDSTVMS